ncbi:MAG: DUF3570 domain-containing protein [Alphaproteobacteria bacterium]|nr:DUF3570 domain-containing protein [Alphaproteobacteria bacterium]
MKKRKRKGQVRESLATFSASLLAATVATHVDKAMAQQQYYDSEYGYNNDNFGPGVAYSELDSALLVYKESSGRVQAIEPATDLSVHGVEGQILTLGLVADAVSGATPNGAVPSDQTQTFVTPVKIVTGGHSGGTTTVTSASGGSTIIHLPSTPGQVSTVARQYTVSPNTLPVDKGFHDHRLAANFSWSQPLGGISLVGFGGGYSIEQDYRAITGNARISQNFNADNTTVSLAVNTELDSSFPYGGVPTPMTVMNGQLKTPTSRSKTQIGFVVDLTEVMTRRWLMQLNYSCDTLSGYQNDPYRIISTLDPVSAEPTSYLYENRPNKRTTQSIFWDNKFDYGPTVTELSLRYFKDSWGITSKTVELSERISLSSSIYVEPNARWYQQSAANFFHYYLLNNQTIPTYASSDTRLGKFTSMTVGLKVGFKLSGRTELYLAGDYYRQTGNGHPASAFGQLRQQNLFGGTSAAFALLGYTWDFH